MLYLRHESSMCWYIKPWPVYGPVIVDPTTTVVYSYKSLRNDIKPVQSLTLIVLAAIIYYELIVR